MICTSHYLAKNRPLTTHTLGSRPSAYCFLPELAAPPVSNTLVRCKFENRASDAATATGTHADTPTTPAPDLPSLLMENRIVYLGMPLTPAVSELVIAELLYLQYRDRSRPIFF